MGMSGNQKGGTDVIHRETTVAAAKGGSRSPATSLDATQAAVGHELQSTQQQPAPYQPLTRPVPVPDQAHEPVDSETNPVFTMEHQSAKIDRLRTENSGLQSELTRIQESCARLEGEKAAVGLRRQQASPAAHTTEAAARQMMKECESKLAVLDAEKAAIRDAQIALAHKQSRLNEREVDLDKSLESVKQQEAEISAVKSERAESEQARAEQARAAEISSLREQIRALGDEKSAMQKTHEAVRYA